VGVTVSLPSLVSASPGFLDAGASSPSSPAFAPVCLAPALPGDLVVFDAVLDCRATLVFALDAGLEGVVPSVVGFEFAATAIPREKSLVIDLTDPVVGGSCIVWEVPLAGATFFLGGIVVVELVRVVIGRVQGGNASWKCRFSARLT